MQFFDIVNVILNILVY